NPYLTPARTIEEFLKLIEPKYNSSIAKLRNNNIDHECIYVVAGFISYVLTCSPAEMRIFSEPLQKNVETAFAVMDGQGSLPNFPEDFPEELSGKSFSELLADGVVKIEIDPRYPQA